MNELNSPTKEQIEMMQHSTYISDDHKDHIRVKLKGKKGMQLTDAFIVFVEYLSESQKKKSNKIKVTNKDIQKKHKISVMRIKRANDNLKKLGLIRSDNGSIKLLEPYWNWEN